MQVQSINPGITSPNVVPQPTGARSSNQVSQSAASPASGLDLFGAADNALAITALQAAIIDLLGDVALLEDDSTLQLMLGLIILIALLQGLKDGQQNPEDMLRLLGGSSGGQQSMAYSYTETTVTIEQTSMIVMTSVELDAFLETGSANQPLGGFFDLVA